MLSVPALITLICGVLAGCTGASQPGTNQAAPPAPSHVQASGAHHAGPLGSAGNPLVLTCAAEAFTGTPGTGPPVPSRPRPEDLAIGPVYIVNGKVLATANPASYGDHGSYKIPLVVRTGSTVTVTIAPAARGHVVIDNPAAQNRGLGGVTAITYHSCPHAQGFFAQGFAFTHRPYRGCVPLDVTIGNRPPVRHVTLSLFARPCRQ
ncbi:MAG: hypothetical protein J2P34_00555 [Actinobacteria bacterium]|nr:hypothetical protein [Actinomycetota bacterium]